MKRTLAVAFTVLALAAPLTASADPARKTAVLNGYEEVPTLSTPGNGRFAARIAPSGDAIFWTLSYEDLESAVTQAHIHFHTRGGNGPIVVFLCSNLGNGPAGTQACPPAPARITGTATAVDVLGNAATQGLAAGEFEEFLDAVRAGATYANVHTVGRPGGEIRGQIGHVHPHLD